MEIKKRRLENIARMTAVGLTGLAIGSALGFGRVYLFFRGIDDDEIYEKKKVCVEYCINVGEGLEEANLK